MNRRRMAARVVCVSMAALLLAGCTGKGAEPQVQTGARPTITQEVAPAQPEPQVTQMPSVSPSPTPTSTPVPTAPLATPTPTQPAQGGTSPGGEKGQRGNSSTGAVKPTPTPEPLTPSGKPYGYYNTVRPTYLKGVLLVNKQYALPRSYGGANGEANAALRQLQAGAENAGFSMPLLSGFRSFETQDKLYRRYAATDGVAAANTYSAWPGHSEHQTGLAFDVGKISNGFGNTPAGRWLAAHAHEYGFIIRYPKGKESITGYQYEPWHIRYLGVKTATAVYESGLCLEEYLFRTTPEVTPAPTATPQPTPSPTPTPEPTPVPTVEPTPEPEVTSTPEFSPQPTERGGET